MNKIAFIAGTLILILDQITKALVLKFVSVPITVLPFFNLALVWNRGISFGLFSNHDGAYGALILTIVSLVIIGFLIIWLTKTTDKWLALAICVVIAGALGNIIDRVRFGAVVDFLDFHVMDWHYPAFNVADSAIVLGIAFILFDSIFFEPKRNAAKSDA